MDGVWVQEQESLGMVEMEALLEHEGQKQWLWEGERGWQLRQEMRVECQGEAMEEVVGVEEVLALQLVELAELVPFHILGQL